MIRIKDIRIKTENILLFLFLLPVIIDQLNGFMQVELGISFSISQLLKTIYLLLSFILLAKLNRKKLIFILIFILILLVPIILNIFSKRIIFLSAFEDLAFVFKVASFPVFLFTFVSLLSKYGKTINLEFYHRTIVWLFYTIFVALIASIFGFGQGMYRDVENVKIGFKGYFIAGNELSSLFLVAYSFFLYLAVSQKSYKSYIYIFMGMTSALLMSTKTSIISFLLITGSIPLLNFKFSGGSVVFFIKNNSKKIMSGIIFLSISLICFYYLFKQNVDLYIDKTTHTFKVAEDIITFMVSARNLRYADSLDVYNKYSFFEKMFGTGWTYPQHFIEKRLWGWGSAETDWLDLLIAHGFVGVVLIYSFWFAVLFITVKKLIGRSSRVSVPSFVAMSLLLINTTFSGHILYSAMTGIYLAFFVSFQFVTIEDKQ
ncbi:MAG TPA: O-antigen ligase family protein [bacterium]|nr:O-antigen ligase family protein [bacterium]